jgi:hypothetical protein
MQFQKNSRVMCVRHDPNLSLGEIYRLEDVEGDRVLINGNWYPSNMFSYVQISSLSGEYLH